MTAKQLYAEVKALYEACPEAAQWFDLQSLMRELWLKYGAVPLKHIIKPDEDVDFCGDFIADVKKALGGYPLQYITGKAAFWSGEFFVGEGVLIPRSDTERIVEAALTRIGRGGVIYDLCCGSGCIGISLLMSNGDIKKCYSFDISKTALEYTEKNAAANGVDDRLAAVEYDVMGGHFPGDIPMPDMIVSNPPYIRADEMPTLAENVRYEPQIALLGGEDGCDFYRRILDDFSDKLPCGGCIVFEIAPGQRDIIARLFDFYGFNAEFFEDYGGNIRAACGKKEKRY